MKTLVFDLKAAALYKRRNEMSDNIRSKYGNNALVFWVENGNYYSYGDSAAIVGSYRSLKYTFYNSIRVAWFAKEDEKTWLPKFARDGYKLFINENNQ